MHCQRTVELIPTTESHFEACFLSETDPSSLPMLPEVPTDLWAKSNYDVGLIKGCEPVIVTPKYDYTFGYKNNTLWSLKQLKGLSLFFNLFRKQALLFLVKTHLCALYYFLLKRLEMLASQMNGVLYSTSKRWMLRTPTVPDPHTILSQIPSDEQFFSVVDLSDAFFSVPVHPDSQFWFAFEFEGRSWTFTRLCQGYCESPTIYNAALKARNLSN